MDIGEKIKIICTEYPLQVIKSKARQTKYSINEKGERYVLNPRTAGKPSFYTVNGQKFYSGFSSHWERIKIVNALKDYFRPFIQNSPDISNFPISLKMEVHSTMKKSNWDLDNHSWIYIKTFQDEYVKQNKIPDDNINYITDIQYCFVPIKNEEDRKLVFTIKQDKRKLKWKI